MRRQNRWSDAEKLYRDARRDVYSKLVSEAPDNAGYRDRTARSHYERADAAGRNASSRCGRALSPGRRHLAEVKCRCGRARLSPRCNCDLRVPTRSTACGKWPGCAKPKNFTVRQSNWWRACPRTSLPPITVATCSTRLTATWSACSGKSKRPQDATVAIRGWLDLHRKICDSLPADPSRRSALAQCYTSTVWQLCDVDHLPQEAEKVCHDGLSVVEKLSTQFPKEAQLPLGVGWA